MTADDYRDLLLALQPPGDLLPRDPDSNWAQLLAAWGEEFARVDASALSLIDEADPRTTVLLLTDWERVAGLPDICAPDEQSTDQRRAALVDRLSVSGSLSRAYYIAAAARLGYTITITEWVRHTCESDCEYPVVDDPWLYTWQVNAPLDSFVDATCESDCEAPLRAWGNDRIECVIGLRKPAHTTVLFAYS